MRCRSLRRNRVSMVAALNWLSMGTARSTRVLPRRRMIRTGNGRSCITRVFGGASASVSWRVSRGVQSVCARTSTLQPLSATTLIHTGEIERSSFEVPSNHCAKYATQEKQIKRWGGVAKMFDTLSCKAGVARTLKKIPNVRISGHTFQRTANYASA